MEKILDSISNKFDDFESNKSLVDRIRLCSSKDEESSIVKAYLYKARTLLRQNKPSLQARLMKKILFLHTLGYPCNFADLECLNMIASNHISAKHMGYLAVSILMSSDSDKALLLCNSLQQDLDNSNQFIIGFALNCIGNLCNPYFADYFPQKLISLYNHRHSYIKKKAILCSARIVALKPQLVSEIIHSALPLIYLNTKIMIMPSLILALEICYANPDYIPQFTEWIPRLIHIQKHLLKTSSESYQIGGVNHPYMQIKVIRLLGIICQENCDSEAEVNSILKQTMESLTYSFLSNQAIMYELFLTIFKLKRMSFSSLKKAAITEIGKFLSSSEQLAAYVALNLLLRVVKFNTKNVKYVFKFKNDIINLLNSEMDIVKLRSLILMKFLCKDSETFQQLVTMTVSMLASTERETQDLVVRECDNLISDLIGKYWQETQSYVVQLIFLLLNNNLTEKLVNTYKKCSTIVISKNFADHELLVWKISDVFFNNLKKTTSCTDNLNPHIKIMKDEVRVQLSSFFKISEFSLWILGEFNELYDDGECEKLVESILQTLEICTLAKHTHKNYILNLMRTLTFALFKILSKRTLALPIHLEKTYEKMRNATNFDRQICFFIDLFNSLEEKERKIIFEEIKKEVTNGLISGISFNNLSSTKYILQPWFLSKNSLKNDSETAEQIFYYTINKPDADLISDALKETDEGHNSDLNRLSFQFTLIYFLKNQPHNIIADFEQEI
ncbi:MAG: AP-1 complex subunit gamma-1 [Paramarteilia canceri]